MIVKICAKLLKSAPKQGLTKLFFIKNDVFQSSRRKGKGIGPVVPQQFRNKTIKFKYLIYAKSADILET